MFIDQKNNVDVQFLNFGTGLDAFSVPIRTRGKENVASSSKINFLRLTTAAMSVTDPCRSSRTAR